MVSFLGKVSEEASDPPLQPTKMPKHADKAIVPLAIVFKEFIYNPLDVSAQESPV
jgi:hypothetical protein